MRTGRQSGAEVRWGGARENVQKLLMRVKHAVLLVPLGACDDLPILSFLNGLPFSVQNYAQLMTMSEV